MNELERYQGYFWIPVAFAGLVLLVLLGKLALRFCSLAKARGTKNALSTYSRAALIAGFFLLSAICLGALVWLGRELARRLAG